MSAVDDLARRIVALERALAAQGTSAQLAYSSIEDGAVQEYDAGGSLVQRIGAQFDGTHVSASLGGPVPATPAPPVVTQTIGGALVRWDGTWEGGGVAPMDFARVEIHVSTDPALTGLIFDTLVGEIIAPRGGESAAVLPTGQHYVALVARSLSGKTSALSQVVGPVEAGLVSREDLNFLSGTTIWYQASQPTGAVGGDLWLETPGNVAYRFDGATWVQVRDQGIVQALLDAQAAQAGADQAGVDALAASVLGQQGVDDAASASTDALVAQAAANAAALAGTLVSNPIFADWPGAYPAGTSFWTGAPTKETALARTKPNAVRYSVAAGAQGGIRLDQGFLSALSGSVEYFTVEVDFLLVSGALGGAGIILDWEKEGANDYGRTSLHLAAEVTAPALNKWYRVSKVIRRPAGKADATFMDGYLMAGWFGLGTIVARDIVFDRLSVRPSSVEEITAFGTPAEIATVTVLANTADAKAVAAQADADAAQVSADQGIAAAGDAQATADGKMRTFFQTTAPTGLVAGDVGDLWFDTDDSNKMWRWSGTAWVVSDDQRIATALTTANSATTIAESKIVTFYQTTAPTSTGRVIGDLWVDTADGNRLYRWDGSWIAVPFGAAAISATARQLGAITTYRQALAPASGMITGDFWIDSDDNKIYRYDGATWVLSQDTAINTAITNAATAQATADGKMRIFTQTTAPTGLVAGDVGDMWIDTDDGNKTYTWSGSAWVARLIGNAAIQPQSLVASDVIATGTVSAALLEAVLILTTEMIAGDPAGTHARMTPTGFRVFAEDLVDGIPNEVIRLGTDTNDYLGIVSPTGELLAGISDEGNVNARGGTFAGTEFDADGLPVGGLTVYGKDFTEHKDDGPRGILAHVVYSAAFTSAQISTEYGLGEISFDCVAGRHYQITFGGAIWYWGDALTSAVFALRYTTDGTAPTITSQLLEVAHHHPAPPTAGQWTLSSPIIVTTTFPPGTLVRILATLRRGYGAGFVRWTTAVGADKKPLRMIVEDVGRDLAETWTGSSGGGTTYTGGTTTATATPKKTYTKTYGATSSATYKGDGSKRTDTTDLVQGYNSANGDGKAVACFPSFTADLAGSTVDKVEVYLYANHWYYNSGGTALIKVHGYSSVPASSPTMTTAISSTSWPKPGGRWVTLPSSLYAGFVNGTHKGIGVGPSGGSNLLYYGRFNGANQSYEPAVRITYTK